MSVINPLFIGILYSCSFQFRPMKSSVIFQDFSPVASPEYPEKLQRIKAQAARFG
jgi:hypothetical protein